MNKIFLTSTVVFLVLIFGYSTVMAGSNNGNGNPHPGYPHDTLIFHVHPWANGSAIDCSPGGHSAHIRAYENGTIMPVNISITMIDWVEGVNDNIANVTEVVDCDGLDGDISIRIRDTNGTKGWISTQDWLMRAVGIPHQQFELTTYGNHSYNCTLYNYDNTPDGDQIPDNDSGNWDDWWNCSSQIIELGTINLSDINGKNYVKMEMKHGGNGNKKGKTSFADITDWFLVDVDLGDPGLDCENPETDDLCGVSIFSLSCEDYDPENKSCPLGSVIWEIDKKTQRPTIQLFVSHTGYAEVLAVGKDKAHGRKADK